MSRIVEEVNDRDGDWDLRRQNLLLSTFGLETVDWNGPALEDVIVTTSDSDLIEMFSLVTGVDGIEVQQMVDSGDAGNWKPGYVRLFISHSAMHRKFVGEVAEELAIVGIHGFVAHDTMEVSKPWQSQIEHALRSAQAFVALIHPEFNDSPWCQQEVGWAFGRRVPKYAICFDQAPRGFIGSTQWPSGTEKNAREVAALITAWVSSSPEMGEALVDGLFTSLETVGNYIDAGAAAKRVAALGNLTPEQWDRLDAIFWGNDQLYTGALPTNALRPFYTEHGRNWPPPKSAELPSGAPF